MRAETEQVMDGPPEISMPFYKIWFTALASPRESTYLRLLQDPGANFRKVLLWLSIVYILEAPVGIYEIYHGILDLIPDMKELLVEVGGLWVYVLILFLILLILIPLWIFLRVLFFFFWTALLDALAIILFRGPGRYGEFIYLAAAYSAPSSLIHLGLKFVPYEDIISIIFTAYQIALTALALKVVNRFSWGRAIGAILIPCIVLLVIIAIAVFYFSSLIENVFDMFGV